MREGTGREIHSNPCRKSPGPFAEAGRNRVTGYGQNAIQLFVLRVHRTPFSEGSHYSLPEGSHGHRGGLSPAFLVFICRISLFTNPWTTDLDDIGLVHRCYRNPDGTLGGQHSNSDVGGDYETVIGRSGASASPHSRVPWSAMGRCSDLTFHRSQRPAFAEASRWQARLENLRYFSKTMAAMNAGSGSIERSVGRKTPFCEPFAGIW